jgi:hypothetical protein
VVELGSMVSSTGRGPGRRCLVWAGGDPSSSSSSSLLSSSSDPFSVTADSSGGGPWPDVEDADEEYHLLPAPLIGDGDGRHIGVRSVEDEGSGGKGAEGAVDLDLDPGLVRRGAIRSWGHHLDRTGPD